MGEKRKKEAKKPQQSRPRAREEQAAPPDSGGSQGSFTRPEDELEIPNEPERREGRPAPYLAEDTAHSDPDERGAGRRAAP